MSRQNHEQSLGQFEQLKEQYMTYAASSQLVQISDKSQRKISAMSNGEKPKLKMVHQSKQKITRTENIFIGNTKRPKKFTSPHAKIISIGDAIFRSNFQSGNIQNVQKIAPATYQITLTKQLNSNRISAWFYFIVEGLKGQAKFVIKGFTKSTSLYNQGMKICYKQSQTNTWRRGGTKIYYTDTYNQNQQDKTSYELHFTFFFKSNPPNGVQFAYCFPYTYGHLMKFLTLNQTKMIASSLGKTFQGRQIPILTIGNEQSDKVIIISARAHPGQTVGSHMMQGFIKQLITDSEHSIYLRQTYLFQIVPMINPDGVANGNYRFSASGFDLNRRWKSCNNKMHPQVYLFKQKIKQISKQKQIIMFMDFHGHSRQKNVFFYGCTPQQPIDEDGNPNTNPRQFPFLMSKLHPAFRYEYSSYAMQKQKQGTARITLWNQIKTDYIYTVQASLSGTDSASFLISDYEKVGAKLCEGIFFHFWKFIRQGLSKQNGASITKINDQIQKNMSEFFQNPQLAKIQYDAKSSDSEPEAGQIPESDRKKQKSAISIQKYYKASRVMKFTDKSFAEQDINSNKHKNNLQNAMLGKYKVQLVNSRNKTNQSVHLIKQYMGTQSNILSPENKCVAKNMSAQITSKIHNQHNYMNQRNEVISHTINERKKLEYIKNNNTTSLENNYKNSLRLASQSFVVKNQNEQQNNARNQVEKNKKKAVSFQGAQYRRVRKLAEEHNKRHFSAQNSFLHIEDETLRKGLVGSNKMVQIEIVGSGTRQRAPSFFPNTAFYSKSRKGSVQTHFRRQIKASDYTSRRFYVNGLEQEVKCYGKQIL